MIGQRVFQNKVDELIRCSKFPRFSIIVAPKGYGKKVVSEYIASKLNATFVPCDCSVESVRKTIFNAYSSTERTLYMYYDCDDMSINSKNALLKVTEESPNDTYFIITVCNLNNVLETMISRGTVFYLDDYSPDDLREYADLNNYSFAKSDMWVVDNVCCCPQDINEIHNVDIQNLCDLADKFIQNIGCTMLANELKFTTNISTKSDDGKISPILMIRCILNLCIYNLKSNISKEDIDVFWIIIRESNVALRELSEKSCNRQMIFDNFILRCHESIVGIGK